MFRDWTLNRGTGLLAQPKGKAMSNLPAYLVVARARVNIEHLREQNLNLTTVVVGALLLATACVSAYLLTVGICSIPAWYD